MGLSQERSQRGCVTAVIDAFKRIEVLNLISHSDVRW
jgi:hypothetical protein